MSSWLDLIPGNERQRIKEKYKLSESAYEKLRDKVKGPEDIAEEMLWNEAMAQLKFGMETEPHMGEALKKQIEKDIAEQGIDAVLDNSDLSDEVQKLLREGKFDVRVDAPANNAPDQIVIKPEGNVSDKLPIRMSLCQSYVSQLHSK